MPGDSESISDTGLVFPLSSWYSYLKALVTPLALYHHQHPHIKTATPWGEQDRCYPHFTEWETISQATSPTSQDSRSWGWSKFRTANFFLFLNLHSQGSNFTGESKCFQFSSVQFSHSVMSDSWRPHELQHARPPYPSPTPRVYSNSCPSSRWCHPAISSFVVPVSSCPQSLPASGSFPMSQLFTWGGQSIFIPI